MASAELVRNLEDNAVKAEQMLAALRRQIEEAKKATACRDYTLEKEELEAENFRLREKVENLKNELITLESRRGLKQVPIPKSTTAKPNPELPAKSAVTQPAAVAEPPKEPTKANKEKKKAEAKSAAPAKKAEDDLPVDVSRLDMRVGKILSVKKHPDADSLYIEEIDVGETKPRTVCSGLVKFLALEDLDQRMVVVMCNLKPAKMRGIISEAMVMCASTPEKVETLIPPTGAAPGDRITFAGYEGKPDAELNPKKKIFEQVAPDLKTDDSLVATYKGVAFEVAGKGNVTTASLKNVHIK